MKKTVVDNQITQGPEWVGEEVREMWGRITKLSEEKGLSYSAICRKYNFSSSALYSAIKLAKEGEPTRDSEIRVIEAFSKELDVPLNYLIHGDSKKADKNDEIQEPVLGSILDMAKGDLRSIFIMTVPYLSTDAYNSVREDIIARLR